MWGYYRNKIFQQFSNYFTQFNGFFLNTLQQIRFKNVFFTAKSKYILTASVLIKYIDEDVLYKLTYKTYNLYQNTKTVHSNETYL